jgi:hypothetical protein
MILSIVIALAIFYFGVPLALWAFVLLCKVVGATVQSLYDLLEGVIDRLCKALNAVAWAIGWAIGHVRAQVQKIG